MLKILFYGFVISKLSLEAQSNLLLKAAEELVKLSF